MRFLTFLLAMLAVPSLAQAQTVTITSPNTVNPSGQPKAVADVFVRNADGTIATISGGGGTSNALPQGSTTAGQAGPLVQCATVTGDQAYVVGTTNPLNCIANGRLKVGLSSAGNVEPAAQLATTLTADLVACKYRAPSTWSVGFTAGVNCDASGNLLTANAASSVAAVGATNLATSAAAGALVVKASAGNLYGLNVTSGATAGYIMVFNAIAAPADGTVTPAKCIPLAANAGIDLNYRATPTYFGTGITVVFSSTGCFTKTSSATAFISGDAK